jgi:putative ABC transport system ATP-binding protein
MSDRHALSLSGVCVVYGSGPAAVRALDGVDLDVRRGEVLALMGPSGSGKTTLLMVMGCLLRPTRGEVRVLGRGIAALGQAKLAQLRLAHIGFVFQAYHLFPALSAGETLRLALELKGWDRNRASAEVLRLLAQVGLADKMNARPAQLSGGQQQRVAIARALAGAPEIILGDEPTGALDSTNGRAVMELLRDLAHQHGRAVVVVTHDTRLGELADRIALIEDGRIRSEPDVPS